MELYPTAGELDIEYILSMEQKRTKPLSREQARKFAQVLIRRSISGLDELHEEVSDDIPRFLPTDALHDDVWNKIARSTTDGTHLALLPNGNVSVDAIVEPHLPALVVFLPQFNKEYIESGDDSLKSEHQSIFDGFSSDDGKKHTLPRLRGH